MTLEGIDFPELSNLTSMSNWVYFAATVTVMFEKFIYHLF